MVLRASQRWRAARAEPGQADPEGPASGSSPELRQLPRDVRPGGGPGCCVLASTRRAGHPCAPLGRSGEEAAHAFQSHASLVETADQREVGAGGLQVRADQAADRGALPRRNNSDQSGSSWLVAGKEAKFKRWCWLVPEAEGG